MPNMFSVSGFCAHHSVSRSLFYRLQKEERGPRLTKIGRRTLITAESAAEWRARMERETEQIAPRSAAADHYRSRIEQGALVSGREAA